MNKPLYILMRDKIFVGGQILKSLVDRLAPHEDLTLLGSETQVLAYLRDLPQDKWPQLRILCQDQEIPKWQQGNTCQCLSACAEKALQELQAIQTQGLITDEAMLHLKGLLHFEVLQVV
ncbi:MAG: hypothetical protein WCI11_15160 [Candidatus Methylumidiphilus sp.]